MHQPPRLSSRIRWFVLGSIAVLHAGAAGAQAQGTAPDSTAGWLGAAVFTDSVHGKPTVQVRGIAEGSAADVAGIRVGDAIRSLNGIPITDAPTFVTNLHVYRPGQTVRMEVATRGASRTVDVTLRPRVAFAGGECMYGMTTDGMSLTRTNADTNWRVSALSQAAQSAGLSLGDQIVAVDGRDVTRGMPAAYQRVIFAHAPGDTVEAQVLTAGQKHVVRVPLTCAVNITDGNAFASSVNAWRALPARPAMPTALDRHRVRAERAVQAGDFVTARTEYQAALAAFPWWPAGWYNLALAQGKAGQFPKEAAADMQWYLYFDPNAPDAAQARAQVAAWQEQARPQVDFSAGDCKYGTANIGLLFGRQYPRWGTLVLQAAGPAARAGLVSAYFDSANSNNNRFDNIVEINGIDFRKDTAALHKLADLLATHHAGDVFNVKYTYVADKNENHTTQITATCRPGFNGDWFHQTIDMWRARTPKPPLPEIVDRYRVLAEYDVQQGHFYDAAVHYEEGLASYPWWPEGWYNLALVDAQSHAYQSAVDEMQQYLLFVPDGPDSRAAREQMYIWQEKAKQ